MELSESRVRMSGKRQYFVDISSYTAGSALLYVYIIVRLNLERAYCITRIYRVCFTCIICVVLFFSFFVVKRVAVLK